MVLTVVASFIFNAELVELEETTSTPTGLTRSMSDSWLPRTRESPKHADMASELDSDCDSASDDATSTTAFLDGSISIESTGNEQTEHRIHPLVPMQQSFLPYTPCAPYAPYAPYWVQQSLTQELHTQQTCLSKPPMKGIQQGFIANGAAAELERLLAPWTGKKVVLGMWEAVEVLQSFTLLADINNFHPGKTWRTSMRFEQAKQQKSNPDGHVRGKTYGQVASCLLQEAICKAPQHELMQVAFDIAEICKNYDTVYDSLKSKFSAPMCHVLEVFAQKASNQALKHVLDLPAEDLFKVLETNLLYRVSMMLMERSDSDVAHGARQELWNELERLHESGELHDYLQRKYVTYAIQSLALTCDDEQAEFLFQNVIYLVNSLDSDEAKNSSFVLEKLLKNRKAAEKAQGIEPGTFAACVAQWLLDTQETDRQKLLSGLKDLKANRVKGSVWQAKGMKNPVDVLMRHINL